MVENPNICPLRDTAKVSGRVIPVDLLDHEKLQHGVGCPEKSGSVHGFVHDGYRISKMDQIAPIRKDPGDICSRRVDGLHRGLRHSSRTEEKSKEQATRCTCTHVVYGRSVSDHAHKWSMTRCGALEPKKQVSLRPVFKNAWLAQVNQAPDAEFRNPQFDEVGANPVTEPFARSVAASCWRNSDQEQFPF